MNDAAELLSSGAKHCTVFSPANPDYAEIGVATGGTEQRTPGRTRAIRMQALGCLVCALAFRAFSLGDPNIHIDENFYFFVGQSMHQGQLPYVDIWDRKPFGLFAIFYLAAAISHSVWSYQLMALVSAAATGFVICRITARWTGGQGAMLAGLVYIVALGPLHGGGGQSPVFYNLPVALAVLLTIQSLSAYRRGVMTWQGHAAMVLCGVALWIKQTVVVEACFLGLFTLFCLWRGGRSFGSLALLALGFVVLGAAPIVLTGVGYAAIGHFAEFWQAMVVSNFSKADDSAGLPRRAAVITFRLMTFAILIFIGWRMRRREWRYAPFRPLILGWLLAATGGFLIVPNFYLHYALGLLPPLSVMAGRALDARRLGVALALVAITGAAISGKSLWREFHVRSMDETARLAQTIRGSVHGGSLLIFDGPPLLYAMSGSRPLSPLVFPNHLSDEIERNTSNLQTDAEMERILRMGPQAVLMNDYRVRPMPNRTAAAMVRHYVETRCRFNSKWTIPDLSESPPYVLYDRCEVGSVHPSNAALEAVTE